jgi:hypothetical protein
MSALPNTQVLNSLTFKAPPLNKSLTLPDLYDWHHENSPTHPLFVYEDGPGEVRNIAWAEVVRGIHRAARLVASRIPAEDVTAALEGRPITIAVLAVTGSCFMIYNFCLLTPCRYRDLRYDRSRDLASWIYRIRHFTQEFT